MKGRLVLGSALLIGAAYFAVFGGEYDFFDLRHVRAQRAIEEARVRADQAEVDAMRARRDSLLHDSAAIERVARERYGLIRDGERAYRFTDPPAASDTDSAVTRDPALRPGTR